MTDAIHYLGLSLTDIRAFGGRRELDLSKDGHPSRWCVIIGENGVGKTTLMQALAAMRPVPAVEPQEAGQAIGEEASVPALAAPALADYENSRMLSLVRNGGEVASSLAARFVAEDGTRFEIGCDVVASNGKLVSVDLRPARFKLAGKGPLVIGYGASRQRGHGNLAAFAGVESTESLYDEQVYLFDPDEIAAEVDYAVLAAIRAKDNGAEKRWTDIQARMTEMVAALIPSLQPHQVSLKERGGITIETPSGPVGLRETSLGAQTMVAWVLDLAWRLVAKFPNSSDPFSESAIVLIDEVELHLHPLWQRQLRPRLLEHFPRIQFIVTTHAPVTAQESVAAGDPISIVRWEGDHSIILPDPFPKAPVRLDEVATELFQLETSLPSRFEELLQERRDLIRRDDLSEGEKYRLLALNRVAHAVRSGSVTTEADMERLMAAQPEAGGTGAAA